MGRSARSNRQEGPDERQIAPSRPSLGSLWTLGLSLSVLPLLARAERIYGEVPQLTTQPCAEDVSSLSIIVPARNEAQNLRRLLPSLKEQDYRGELEIIVVDDLSTDATISVVEREIDKMGKPMRLIRVESLPPGWHGKAHACHMAAQAAVGEWLLFTDADTRHEPLSAASAVAFAEANGLDGLSLFPQQRAYGVLDGAVLMIAFASLFAGMQRSTALLNGQYILIRRDVYEASGGFSAVRLEMMDDLAFGELLAAQGYQVPIMRGEALVNVHMYRDWQQLWNGFSRLGSGSLRYYGWMALIPTFLVTGLMTPVMTILFYRHHLRRLPVLKVVWATALVGLIPWAKRFDSQQDQAATSRTEPKPTTPPVLLRTLLAPFAAVFVQVSAVWGLVSRLFGSGVSWKDRRV